MFALKELNSNKQLEADLKEIFLKHFKKMSQHKKNLSFEDVITSAFSVLGIDYTGSSFPALNHWFDKVYEMSFISNLVTDKTEEFIFHSANYLQITDAACTKFIDIQTLDISEDFDLILETLCLKNSVNWNTSSPFASFKAQIAGHKFRVSLTHKSTLTTGHHKAFFRVLRDQIFELESFTEKSPFIRDLVRNKNNVLISGATGSGKTSFIRALLDSLEHQEHVILLEDTEELSNECQNFTCMLSGDGEQYSLEKYCEYAMRMRPDRMILGEMRSKEVVPFMLSMNNGHKGLMSTIHANSAYDAVLRVALLFEFYNESQSITYDQILKLISKDLDYVIHMEYKKVTEIIKVIGYSNQKIRFETIYSSNNQA